MIEGILAEHGLIAAGSSISYDDNFASNSWETIIKVCKNRLLPPSWKIGDKKTIVFNNSESIDAVIVGLSHDNLSDGSGKAMITFCMENCFNDTNQINTTQTNITGWHNSWLRSQMGSYLSNFPSALASGIKYVNKVTTIGNDSASLTTTQDRLWLFSATEVFDQIDAEREGYYGEGSRYSIFVDAASRIKDRSWWLRTPQKGTDKKRYLRVYDNGGLSVDGANYYRGIALGFCL